MSFYSFTKPGAAMMPALRPRSHPRIIDVHPRASSAFPYIAPSGSPFEHEALRETTDRTPIAETILGPWPANTERNRVRLSRISRTMYENGGFVGYAVDQVALYAAPIIPQAASDDPQWNDTAEDWFANTFSPQCDFLGRPAVDFPEFQRLISVGMDLDGDSGVIFMAPDVEGLLPRIQLIEGHRIETPQTRRGTSDLVDGVRLDPAGRLLGYFVTRGSVNPRGGVDTVNEFVDGNAMLLVYDPTPLTPFRGLSALRRGLNDIRDARDILHFEKILVKKGSALDGFFEGVPMDDNNGFKLSTDVPPDDASPGEKAMSTLDLKGGDIPQLPPGVSYKPVQPTRPTAGFGDFQSMLTGAFAAGYGIPPAFFLDEKLTGPNVRSVIGKAVRHFKRRQKAVARFVRWTWVRAIGWAITTGRLPSAPGWERITFQTPQHPGIDLGDEAAADRDDFAAGLKTRSEIWGKRGHDWRSGVTASFEEDAFVIENAKRIAKQQGVPLELLLQRHFPNPAAQQQQGQNQKAKPENEKKA